MKSELPPPVTIKSSKRALWADLKALEQEVESQQAQINELRAERNALRNRANGLAWQLRMVREVISPDVG